MKTSTAEQYKKYLSRNVDQILWEKTKKLSKGTTKDRISAVNIIFKNHYSLPKECILISKKLSYKNQPLKVRLQIAHNLNKYMNVPFEMFNSVTSNLQEDNNKELINILVENPIYKTTLKFQNIFSPIIKKISNNFISLIDWKKFRKAYEFSMLKSVNRGKNGRNTAILGQVLAEYWLDKLIKNIFQNSKKISDFGFDKKRKILFGLNVLNSNTDNDLKKLDDIRSEYAHNFVVNNEKVLNSLEKMNCYKNMKFRKNSKNDFKVKKCIIKLILDLMDIEEKYVKKNIN